MIGNINDIAIARCELSQWKSDSSLDNLCVSCSPPLNIFPKFINNPLVASKIAKVMTIAIHGLYVNDFTISAISVAKRYEGGIHIKKTKEIINRIGVNFIYLNKFLILSNCHEPILRSTSPALIKAADLMKLWKIICANAISGILRANAIAITPMCSEDEYASALL